MSLGMQFAVAWLLLSAALPSLIYLAQRVAGGGRSWVVTAVLVALALLLAIRTKPSPAAESAGAPPSQLLARLTQIAKDAWGWVLLFVMVSAMIGTPVPFILVGLVLAWMGRQAVVESLFARGESAGPLSGVSRLMCLLVSLPLALGGAGLGLYLSAKVGVAKGTDQQVVGGLVLMLSTLIGAILTGFTGGGSLASPRPAETPSPEEDASGDPVS